MFRSIFIGVNDTSNIFAVKAIGPIFNGDIGIGIFAVCTLRADDADTAWCTVCTISAIGSFFTNDEAVAQF